MKISTSKQRKANEAKKTLFLKRQVAISSNIFLLLLSRKILHITLGTATDQLRAETDLVMIGPCDLVIGFATHVNHRFSLQSAKKKKRKIREYRKTPLISTYVFSGLGTEEVLIFGAVLTFGGYDKAE